jgi:hypothetical protein
MFSGNTRFSFSIIIITPKEKEINEYEWLIFILSKQPMKFLRMILIE